MTSSRVGFRRTPPSFTPRADRSSSVLCILDTETARAKRLSPASLGATLGANVWAQ